MEAIDLTLSSAQTLFSALQCSELKHLFSIFGYKSELEKLDHTIQTIKSVLLDVEAKVVLNQQEQKFIDNLKSVVYEADDLLDEFATLAAGEIQQHTEKGHGFFKKVRHCISRFEEWSVAYDMSREVKHIRERLDGIANDASKFCFKVDNQPIRLRREETCSYVYKPDIIGREDDTMRIVDMLLDPNIEGHLPVLTIVGMGGLGKTTLAQLVFNDERIAKEFKLRLWTCVSDDGQPHLNVESLLSSILKSASGERHIDDLGKEQLQRQLREKLDGNKYLLILDDVWTENRGDWLKLVVFLKGSHRGSRIVVTTRSKATAVAAGSGDKLIYELQGLSDDNSWRLFEVTVEPEKANQPDLVDIGKAIVKKCVNVPLAIKVIGTLLYGQDENKWRSFQNSKLSEIRKDENEIMQILKFSYHHLRPSIKSCFSYCALFPKDFVIQKEKLISLWMAQGYIEPLDEGQTIEDAAAEYFVILLRRCFFQDVRMDEHGEIVSCKIHDLMHDVAQEVARKEICLANSTSVSNLGENIRHISHTSRNCSQSFFTKTKIRTYLLHDHRSYDLYQTVQFPMDPLLANLTCLRVLDLSKLSIQTLPDTIGGLLHLRYLDLSWNIELQMLPESIAKLHNLQTLNLCGCSRLIELPKDFSKLVNLRILDIAYCRGLTYMPSGMKKLTCLSKLPMFIVAGRNANSKQCVGDMDDLGALKKLKGNLTIHISNEFTYVKEKRGEEAGYLIDKEHLNDIHIEWLSDGMNESRVQHQEALLEYLQPHRNLRVLNLKKYPDKRIPRWAREDNLATFLPNLVKIELTGCERLLELPCLSKLRCLKTIGLYCLYNLEFMEDNTSCSSSTTSSRAAGAEIESSFFPSLKELELIGLQKLKGWWRGCGSTVGHDHSVNSSNCTQPAGVLPAFPRLSTLKILYCPKLASVPPCPTLENLTLHQVNERLQIVKAKLDENSAEGSGSSSFTRLTEDIGNQRNDSRLRTVVLTNVGYLKHQPMEAFRYVTKLRIHLDKEVENLSGVQEVFCSCSSSLRSLTIQSCSKLRNLSGGGLEHLTALVSLTLEDLSSLRFTEDEDGEKDDIGIGSGMPWRFLGQNLRSLEFFRLRRMVKLPKGMRHLTSLQSLTFYFCPLEELPEWIGSGCFSSLEILVIGNSKLKSLPEAMRNVTTLRKLEISYCPWVLKQRCRSQDGEDWPKIQHIPNFVIKEYPHLN